MSDTLGSIRAEILLHMRGDLKTADDQPLLNAVINDSLEDIWLSMMPVQIARFMGLDSPVTFSLASGVERQQLVSIPDPTTALASATIVGGNLGARNYIVGYTYVTESGSETQLSPTTTFAIGANNLATVPPPPQNLPTAAFGWNLYASVTNNFELMALQNQQPLGFQFNFQEPPAGWADYPTAQQEPGEVQTTSSITLQAPSENTTADNISWITHLEVRTSDTLLRTWNQVDINSEIMKRYGRELSSASEYQTYVWDLINGNRFEIRPTTGLAFSPRYFYIAKPRRLRYDQATLPYQNIAGVHEFIINKSVSRLKLDLDEYLAAQGWAAQAEATRLNIQKALRMEDWAKNQRIAPHLF